jgi:hypothetical protein
MGLVEVRNMEKNIESGDDWPYHYRGTRYHYNGEKVVWWRTFKDGLEVRVKSGQELVIDELISLRSEGGSFRVTESGDVLIKLDKGNIWTPKYVCEMDEPFRFEKKIDISPTDISPGDLWPGFYDGARYSYLNDRVWWRNPDGPRQYIRESLPDEVMMHLKRFKPMGGSFRITENGYVITLIPKQPLPNNIKEQWEALSATQQRLVATKVETTDMLPVYIGRYHEGVSLLEPKDFKKPLSKQERKEMLEFLDSFSMSGGFNGMVPRDVTPEKLGDESEEFLDDPEDW